MQQLATKEFIEFKLQEIAQKKERVMVRITLFGGVEMCVFGELTMDFDKDDACPFFVIQHPTQHATLIRFYGSDVVILRNINGAPEILLGVPPKTIDNLNDLP